MRFPIQSKTLFLRACNITTAYMQNMFFPKEMVKIQSSCFLCEITFKK